MTFRFLHMLMVFPSSWSAATPWMRQRAEDSLLMKRVVVDSRTADEYVNVVTAER
ncbi:TPA: hypothetical protein ACXZX6_001023 [Salmonella enterica]|nr:hypothetical protein [Salmonella enterica]EGI5703290.1 hypothetical protein [Salmonella enterica subsp. enterica serovar Chester]EKB5042229.1 hypothetical protein [Salmonella enterica]EME1067390.1 hypothetical protein [Salmonella enterica]